jgi:hypothetical protein
MSAFVVTSLHHAATTPVRSTKTSIARAAKPKSRIGEQFELWADGASWATMAANQLRSVSFR